MARILVIDDTAASADLVQTVRAVLEGGCRLNYAPRRVIFRALPE